MQAESAEGAPLRGARYQLAQQFEPLSIQRGVLEGGEARDVALRVIDIPDECECRIAKSGGDDRDRGCSGRGGKDGGRSSRGNHLDAVFD